MRRSAPLLRALLACSALTTFAGCAHSVKPERLIPGPPAYLQPAAVPEPEEGEPDIVVAERERAGRLKANRAIRSARRDWKQMQATYAKGR